MPYTADLALISSVLHLSYQELGLTLVLNSIYTLFKMNVW